MRDRTPESDRSRLQHMYIDGEWVHAFSGRSLDVINPADEQILARVPAGSSADVDRAVRAARTAFDNDVWMKLGPSARARVLLQIAERIEGSADELARSEVLENGMPLAFAQRLIRGGAETFRYFAGWVSKIHGLTSDFSAGQLQVHAYTRREPVGVVAAIIPWNAPFSFACSKLAAALAAGCTCVLKPAEQTPLGALQLARMAAESGVPAGVLNVITGTGEEAGATLVEHPGVDKIAFTGSTSVGRSIIRAAATQLKRVTLELGGKSPVIVLDDADLEAAVPGATLGAFQNSGQICMAGTRVYVQQRLYERFVADVAGAARSLKIGDGLAAGVQIGPLISARQRHRVMEYVEGSVTHGAEIVTGGRRWGERGYFVEPTVVVRANQRSPLMQEEVFGPVVAIVPFGDLDEAVALANDTTYGLAAAVWTRDISKAHLLAKRIRAGTVWLNCELLADRSLPFGGFKQSGLGREHGAEGLESYLETKSVIAVL